MQSRKAKEWRLELICDASRDARTAREASWQQWWWPRGCWIQETSACTTRRIQLRELTTKWALLTEQFQHLPNRRQLSGASSVLSQEFCWERKRVQQSPEDLLSSGDIPKRPKDKKTWSQTWISIIYSDEVEPVSVNRLWEEGENQHLAQLCENVDSAGVKTLCEPVLVPKLTLIKQFSFASTF